MGAGDASQFNRKTAIVGDLTIRYFKGSQGKPLLYLHGLAGWGRWETYHLALGMTNQVYAPQLPGWQDGHIPPGVRSVQDYARIMTQFLDVLGLETIDLVGHSFGGWIGLYMALDQPERIAKLVLADAMGLDVPAAPATSLNELDEDALLTAAFAKTGVVLVAGDFGGALEDLRQGQEFKNQWRSRCLIAELVRGQYADPELTQRLDTITADTLVVWGREDKLVPLRHGEVLAERIPQAKLVVIAESGHTPMREKRETFQRIVRDFLIGQEEDFA